MIDAVVANFIDSVEEREFDAAFLAILRSQGFYDIHFTHGAYEFGKDFIAKSNGGGVELQYVFQSKAGDLNLQKWAETIPQIELLRHSELSHPNFDRSLPRRAIFSLTGRLIGGGISAAQDFCRQSESASVPLTIWDRERLIEFVSAALNVGLAERVEAPFLAAIAAASSGSATDTLVERLSQRWCVEDSVSLPCTFEAVILATALYKSSRSDLAAVAGLALVRAACCHTQERNDLGDEWHDAGLLGRRLFQTYSYSLLDKLGPDGGPSPSEMVRVHREPGALITHAVRCVKIAEIVGLLGLLPPDATSSYTSRDIAVWLSRFIHRNTATSSILSDRYAVAAIPAVLLLAKHGLRDRAGDYLREIFLWISQRYGGGMGLADVTSTPEAEVRQVLGKAIPQVTEVRRRDESYLASVLLDLCAYLRFERLYTFIRDDFRRLRISMTTVTTADTTGQYLLDSSDVWHELNVAYADVLSGDWARAAPHLAAAAIPRYLESVDRSWDHLAVSALIRDRHFVCAWSSL